MKIAAGLFILAAYMPYLVWAADVDLDDASHVYEHRIICKCTLNYEPVCGSNGITYSNACILRCVSDHHERNGRPAIRELHCGECRPLSCCCPKDSEPICGTNNHTYFNDCYRVCENVRREEYKLPPIGLAYKGKCKKPSCICPDCEIPVCGTDGKTYRNTCILQCYSRLNVAKGLPPIYVKSPHACKNETCNCPLIKKQLCASDGKTYLNKCVLDCQNRRRCQLGLKPLTVQYPGECINCICTANIAPVCGSDGKTYSNECWLACENKKRKRLGLPELKVRWHGPCNCGCTGERKPVCASDKKTWTNQCQLDCENKKRALSGLHPLAVLYKGKCRPCYCGYCNNLYKPVCGSNKITYWNDCHLECNSDCRVANGLPPIKKICDKEC